MSGHGDLDGCNGRNGWTSELPNGNYPYGATDACPYLQRCVQGQW